MPTNTNTTTTTIIEPAAPDLGGVALTRLLQIVSPALPIGAFAYSQGLEQAVASGWVTNETEAAEWLLGLLGNAVATLDLPVLDRLLGAWRSADDAGVQRWSGWLLACRATRETRAEDRQLGAALARVLEALGIEEAHRWASRADVTHAAMFALAAARFRIPTEVALVGYAFAWSEALVSAAVRLVPLGQSAGQRVLALAGEAIPPAVAEALQVQDDDIGAVAYGQTVASALHENLYSRLFRS